MIIGEAKSHNKVLVVEVLYVNTMVVTDAFSQFCFFHHAPKADTVTVIRALSKFVTYWRLVTEFTLITYRGFHFANSLLELIQKEFVLHILTW
eukprot:snap_masked-scaffold_21-processed-gene-5.37-mRNA-1 protein AED:1.00 eAED:1.00 QI:0/0/0/0/1/1/2/0/92